MYIQNQFPVSEGDKPELKVKVVIEKMKEVKFIKLTDKGVVLGFSRGQKQERGYSRRRKRSDYTRKDEEGYAGQRCSERRSYFVKYRCIGIRLEN